MKKFLLNSLLFSLVLLSGVYFLSSSFDGYTDPFYVRFTSQKQSSMILGTSRAAQGIQPEVINNVLGESMFNYSFTVVHSPFGAAYLNSIKRKHRPDQNGLFIIAVDPWSITSWSEDPDNEKAFREIGRCVENTFIVDQNPNLLYTLRNFDSKMLKSLGSPSKKTFLHNDGWLEVQNIAMDPEEVERRTLEKLKKYGGEHLLNSKLSGRRIDYLLETIDYLKQYGEVYLVRLPIDERMNEIEDQLLPDFDQTIQEAIDMSNGYLDLTPENSLYQYTDGNHLFRESGKEVSRKIAEWIRGQRDN